MDLFFTDSEIADLLEESKSVGIPLSQIGSPFKEKRGHNEYDLTIRRSAGGEFKVIIRQAMENPLAFSVILGYVPKEKTEVFILRRYNGKNHRHGNRLEKDVPFYDFHIHTATERYQMEAMNEETYAEATDRYGDLNGAIDCLISDCNIVSTNQQPDLPL
ncbi:MAG: hypothetical protein ACKVRN_16455 [Pyrinomonadaceae bacterium]